MEKFIVIYHTPIEAAQQMENVSQEDQAKGMEAWMTWAKKCGNKLLDLGSPLMNGQQLNADGSSTKSTKNVNGYSILQAESMEEAQALLQDHPHSGWNAACSIEIHETMPLPGM